MLSDDLCLSFLILLLIRRHTFVKFKELIHSSFLGYHQLSDNVSAQTISYYIWKPLVFAVNLVISALEFAVFVVIAWFKLKKDKGW